MNVILRMPVGREATSVPEMLCSPLASGRDAMRYRDNRLVREVVAQHCVDESFLGLPFDNEVQAEVH